jgi:hypothetical protein
MNRIFRQLRTPAVATALAAVAILALAVIAYGVFRPQPHASSGALRSSSGTLSPTSQSASGRQQPTAGTAPSTTAASRSKAPSGSTVISWIMQYTPGGTGGGPLGSSLPAYYWFSRADCPTVSDLASQMTGATQVLYEGAGDACFAAFQGQPDLWAQAETDLSLVNPSSPAFQCWDHDAYALLQSLINIHRKYPGYQIIRGKSSAQRTSCPLITQIVPDHGPLQGGQQVQVRGVNLPPTLIVSFNLIQLDPVPTNDGQATVITPPGAYPEAVPVLVDDLEFELGSAVTYTYDQPSSTASTPSSTASTPSPGS